MPDFMNRNGESDDENFQTSRTFQTPEEALAFMLGFRAAASETVFATIDPEEPQTILLNLMDEDAQQAWAEAKHAVDLMRHEHAANRIDPPTHLADPPIESEEGEV